DFKNQGEFIQRTVGVLGPPLYDPNHPNNPHYWKSVEHEYERFTKWDSAVRVYVRAELDAIKVDRFGRPDALTLRPAPYSQPQPAVRLWDALEVRIKRLDQWINSENG